MASKGSQGQKVASLSRIVVVGAPRSGTTLLASLLAKLGTDFGVEQRAWDVNSGYYEHPSLLKIYCQLRKQSRLARYSDNLAQRAQAGAIRGLGRLLADVQAIKYPPLSTQLPFLVAQAGFAPILVISARLFEPYAISRMRMEGIGFDECKRDYLEIYRSSQLMLKVYEGVVIDYEGLLRSRREPAIQQLARLTGAELTRVEQVVASSVAEARSHAEGSAQDPECRAVYDQLTSLPS
jgi:hypothetical protein